MSLSVVPITYELLTCYENLSQHYEAEFSPLTGKVPNREGKYDITALDDIHKGFLCLDHEGSPLGFAVVDLGRECFDIAEFYVIPTARNKKFGFHIAASIFDMYPGKWQVRQIEGADKAHSFWVRTISAYTNGAFSNTRESDPDWGVVRVQRFVSRKAAVDFNKF